MKLIRPFLYLILLTAMTSCAGTSPTRAYIKVANELVKNTLTPNDPNLPFPIYASFEEMVSLFNQNDGRTYVVNFWATWCRPCIKELPYFEQLAKETSRNDLQVIMVSLDKPQDIRGKLKDFVEERPMQLPVVSFTDNNYNGWLHRVDRNWRGGSIPVTLFYNGSQRKFNRGQISSYQELQGLVAQVE